MPLPLPKKVFFNYAIENFTNSGLRIPSYTELPDWISKLLKFLLNNPILFRCTFLWPSLSTLLCYILCKLHVIWKSSRVHLDRKCRPTYLGVSKNCGIFGRVSQMPALNLV